MFRPEKTHYEVLELDERCSAKDIRLSFVTLSKKYHPDTNSKDPALHAKFVRINEAYSVLSKYSLRQVYDNDLRIGRRLVIYRGANPTNGPSGPDGFQHIRWRDDSIRQNYQRRSGNTDCYYGINGISKKSNITVAAAVCVVMVIGALLHYCAMKQCQTFCYSQQQADEKLMQQLNARNLTKAGHNTIEG